MRIIALHLVLGAAWLAAIKSLPSHPPDWLSLLVGFGGGTIALGGPALIAYWRRWL